MLKNIAQTVCWVSPSLVFLFLSACTQVTQPQSTTGEPSGSATEVTATTSPSPAVTPEPQSETVAPPTETRSTDDRTLQSKDLPTRTNPVPDQRDATAGAKQTATIAKPHTASDSLNPTFRTSERMAGFSTDGDYFIYLESSRDTGAGIPKSTMQLVALDSNACIQGGCLKTRYSESDSALSLKVAEDSLLEQTWSIRQNLQLTPPAGGDSLPVLSRSRTADGTETMTVRLANQQPLQLRLQQKRIPAQQIGQEFTKDRAAMQIAVSYDGQRRSLGSLNEFRDWVLDYSIREVKLSPDGKHVVVLVTAMEPAFEGTLATTIVQGFEL
ncbi:DUF2259 domain-containing protein [Pantanalinema sp. GBBB05]|uniref:DUF2259 domain-containing protein n=1 Tax=Pantanalinema sp. GBBB05 TaxID=2604139 RepID=UPI003D81B327